VGAINTVVKGHQMASLVRAQRLMQATGLIGIELIQYSEFEFCYLVKLLIFMFKINFYV
jgi:hypothetical protein